MPVLQSTNRKNKINAQGLIGFNGVLSATLLPIEGEDNYKFTANVTFETGNVQTPSVTFSPANDNGTVKEFNDADDLLAWLNGAFFDITVWRW